MEHLADTKWDAVVVGAGPAGGVAAAMLAQRGWRVLLVEKSHWPRDKVCGGCINAKAADLLVQAKLGSALRPAVRLDRATWHVGNQSLHLAAPGGAALLRSQFDAAIVSQAVQRGCTFISGIGAALLPADSSDHRTIRLQSGVSIRAAMVLACDGIGGTLLASEPWAKWHIASNAWIGVSTTCAPWRRPLEAGCIHMHVGVGGYVGLVRLPDGRVHLAAALDPIACRNAGGPSPLIATILDEDSLVTSGFRGTGLLTRRRLHVSGHRVLAVGDAIGYVEPFTGEGMAWAINSASAAVTLLSTSLDAADRWQQQCQTMMWRKQRLCRLFQPVMHHPLLAKAVITLGQALPAVSEWLAARVCRPRLGEAQ